MFEEEELKNLMRAVEGVEFLQNKQESDLLAKVAGVENTDKLKRLRFADDLRNQLRDLFYEGESIRSICPPSNLDLIDLCEKTAKNPTHMASIMRDCIEIAFRCGYYFAMDECGGRWQAPYRFSDDYLKATGLELVPAVEDDLAEEKDMEDLDNSMMEAIKGTAYAKFKMQEDSENE